MLTRLLQRLRGRRGNHAKPRKGRGHYWWTKEGPWVTVFVKWTSQRKDEHLQRQLQDPAFRIPGSDRPGSFWTAKEDYALKRAEHDRQVRLVHGGTHGSFEQIVEAILPTLPCVRFAGGVGYDNMFPSASFSALVTDVEEFKAAARNIIEVANQRMPGINIEIDWIQERDRF